jgi:hemerythrin
MSPCSRAKPKSVLAETLEELIQYTRMHFTAEENLLESSRYPDLSIHRLEHDRFVRTVEEFQKHFQSGQQFLSVQLMDFLKEWLTRPHSANGPELHGFSLRQGSEVDR